MSVYLYIMLNTVALNCKQYDTSLSNSSVQHQLLPLLSSQNSGGLSLVTEQKYLHEQWKVSSHKIKIELALRLSLCNYLYSTCCWRIPIVHWLIPLIEKLQSIKDTPTGCQLWNGAGCTYWSHCAMISYTHIAQLHLAPHVQCGTRQKSW